MKKSGLLIILLAWGALCFSACAAEGNAAKEPFTAEDLADIEVYDYEYYSNNVDSPYAK